MQIQHEFLSENTVCMQAHSQEQEGHSKRGRSEREEGRPPKTREKPSSSVTNAQPLCGYSPGWSPAWVFPGRAGVHRAPFGRVWAGCGRRTSERVVVTGGYSGQPVTAPSARSAYWTYLEVGGQRYAPTCPGPRVGSRAGSRAGGRLDVGEEVKEGGGVEGVVRERGAV